MVSFVYDPDGRDSIKGVRLIGSWDKDGAYCENWDQSSRAMKRMPDGTFRVDVPLDPAHSGDWQYGLMADGPSGDDKWAVLEESNPTFRLSEETDEVVYRPTNIRQSGVNRHGDDVSFSYWAPNAQQVSAVLSPDSQDTQRVPLTRNERGSWGAKIDGAWSAVDGKSYAFEVKDSQGQVALRVDPYARQRMGPQRGVDDLYLHAETGVEVHKFHPDRKAFTRFEVQEYPGLASARVVFSDDAGQDLSADALLSRLGTDGKELVSKFHAGSESDYWSSRLNPDGSIQLLPQGKAFASTLPEAEKLLGLSYRFEGFDRNGNLLGDSNHNGKLEPDESKKLSFNDPFSSKLEGQHRSQRLGIIEDNHFDWKSDKAPRLAGDFKDQVVYQMHPGSIFGSDKNVDRSSFKDIIARLDYFKDLGVNVIEMLPANSTEGSRDWGYIGSHNMAITENYGFTDDDGKWVQGDDALKMFVDAAHEKGLKVFNDVVYNHFGGDFNTVWNVGGPENPWFEWSESPTKPGESIKQTPWGALPAYNKSEVRDYITNHALNQLDEFHFDGLRFDFTHPIHEQGPNGGGTDGWEMLQKINRTINFFHPEAFTAAEEFPNSPTIVRPALKGETGGAGFKAMWNTEFQHRLVHDNGNPSVLQEAAQGHYTHMDKLMDNILHQPGFDGASTSVTVVSNHDEVGNADRILNVANEHKDPSLAGPWERGVTRTSTMIGLLSPGMPMFFQGDESMATNKFNWGIPSTWDVGWDWMEQPDSARFKHHEFTKEVLSLRKSSDAFDADSQVRRVYTHEQDSVMAFSRKANSDEFLVVSSFNKGDLSNYRLPTDGRWERVLSSDDVRFGGEDKFAPRVLDGNNGTVDLAAGATVVFKRVD
jgi:maltooligosyltrehalose trehalohydrolase